MNKIVCQKISIVIPTLNRGQLLLDTINYLSQLETQASELIIVDQTPNHPQEIESALSHLQSEGLLQWVRLEKPSVVAAMNAGLQQAKSSHVLFLDDDIKPIEGLLDSYYKLLGDDELGIIAGRVIQPWDNPQGEEHRLEHPFNSLSDGDVNHFIGANFLVRKAAALDIGGFDENFKGTSHDYEREFSDRIRGAGFEIRYRASAAVFHLKEQSGGIRTYGHFLKTAKPHAAVGAYYYILRSKLVRHKVRKIARRLFQRLATKTHLKQPWWIPLTLIGDCLGILWAIRLRISAPGHIPHKQANTPTRKY